MTKSQLLQILQNFNDDDNILAYSVDKAGFIPIESVFKFQNMMTNKTSVCFVLQTLLQ